MDYVNTFHIEKTWENDEEKDEEDQFYGWTICMRQTPPGGGDGNAFPDKLLWIAPCSENLNFPPQKGWTPFDPNAEGNPTIKYILNKEI